MHASKRYTTRFAKIKTKIQIGGPIVKNSQYYSRLKWIDEHTSVMNERTKEWYLKLKHKISTDRRYLYSSPGILVALLNAASTTVGLLSSNFNMNNEMKALCMSALSSDDSTTKYLSNSSENNVKCVLRNKQNLSLIGINLRPDKTFFLPEGIVELVLLGIFIGNLFLSKVQKFRAYVHHMGATARLQIDIDACKRLWRMKEVGTNIR